jgi:hypothetical protein
MLPVLALNTRTASSSLALAGRPLMVSTAAFMEIPSRLGSRVTRSVGTSGGGGVLQGLAPRFAAGAAEAPVPQPLRALRGGAAASAGPGKSSPRVVLGLQRFQELLTPSNAATALADVLSSSPPPLRFFLHGCRPASMRRSASLPAAVGALHCWLSLWLRLAAHPPQREQKVMGTSPWVRQTMCPLRVKSRVMASTCGPGHLWFPPPSPAAASLVHPAQTSQRQAPARKRHRCLSCRTACSALDGLGRLCMFPGAGGNSGNVAAAALATRGARLR